MILNFSFISFLNHRCLKPKESVLNHFNLDLRFIDAIKVEIGREVADHDGSFYPIYEGRVKLSIVNYTIVCISLWNDHIPFIPNISLSLYLIPGGIPTRLVPSSYLGPVVNCFLSDLFCDKITFQRHFYLLFYNYEWQAISHFCPAGLF